MFDEIFENRYKEYRLRERIDIRDNIEIYTGNHIYTGKKVLIKLEPVLSKIPKLSYENRIFSSLKNLRGIKREF
jgi:hypothetical protein